MKPLHIRSEVLVLPTYLPAAPDLNPMFLEKRVYQGSSGKVYPLPFTDRISETPVDREWKAIWIENEFLHVLRSFFDRIQYMNYIIFCTSIFTTV